MYFLTNSNTRHFERNKPMLLLFRLTSCEPVGLWREKSLCSSIAPLLRLSIGDVL